MTNLRRITLLPLLVLIALAAGKSFAQQVPTERPPASVGGNWTFYTRGDDGKTGTHFLEIVQDGTTLTGHFKGPNQSGGIEGTIDAQHVVIKTKTRHVFTFRGRVDGNSIQGNCGIMGHHCTFQGVRQGGTPGGPSSGPGPM